MDYVLCISLISLVIGITNMLLLIAIGRTVTRLMEFEAEVLENESKNWYSRQPLYSDLAGNSLQDT